MEFNQVTGDFKEYVIFQLFTLVKKSGQLTQRNPSEKPFGDKALTMFTWMPSYRNNIMEKLWQVLFMPG